MGYLATAWQFWALLAAVFAALTAVFAKVGVSTVDPDLATFIRTIVIVLLLGLIVLWKNDTAGLSALTPRAMMFLVMSGFATGASWLCYFRALHLGDASKVAPVDKLSVVFVAIWSSPGLMDTFHPKKESVFHAENEEPVPDGISGADGCTGAIRSQC